VLLFAAALALTTGISLGLFPAWHNTRADLVTTIRSNAGQIVGARSAARFRASLVTAQISLATALLIAAGLFMRSLVNVTRVDLGIRVDSVVTFYIAPQRAGYDSVRMPLLYARVEEALGALPGVTGVTSGTVPLLANLYLISTLVSTIWTFGDYAPVLFVSGGAPAFGSEVVSTLGFHYALDYANPPFGVAAGLSVLPLLIPAVILLMYRLKRTEVQL